MCDTEAVHDKYVALILLHSSRLCYALYFTIDVKHFLRFFYSCHVSYVFNFFVIFWTFFIGRQYYRSCLWHDVSSVCLSVCRLSVTFCIVAKRYVLAKKCLKEWIGNQGRKVHFFGSPPYFYFRFCRYGHQDGRFCLIFARTAKQSVLDGRNWLSSSKPCAYCWIVQSELNPEVVLATFALRESLRPKL